MDNYSPPLNPMDLDPEVPAASAAGPEGDFIGPLLPGAYFKIIPYPHSTNPTSLTIPLAGSRESLRQIIQEGNLLNSGHCLWLPFQMQADFEVVEIVVKGGLNAEFPNKLLDGVYGNNWGASNSRVTIKNSDQLAHVLESAHRLG
jgi:hypothetical protein